MDDDMLRLCLVAFLTACITHSVCRKPLVACVIAAAISPYLYAIWEAIRHPDAVAGIIGWMPMIAGFGSITGFCIASVVGLPFYLIRRHNRRLQIKRANLHR